MLRLLSLSRQNAAAAANDGPVQRPRGAPEVPATRPRCYTLLWGAPKRTAVCADGTITVRRVVVACDPLTGHRRRLALLHFGIRAGDRPAEPPDVDEGGGGDDDDDPPPSAPAACCAIPRDPPPDPPRRVIA